MSRIGKKPITLPKGVTVKVGQDALDIQGPKGKLMQRIPPASRSRSSTVSSRRRRCARIPELGKFHGLARSLAANGVLGVTEGFKRELDIVGVGYRAELRGKQVVFALGLFASGRLRRADRVSTSRSTSRPIDGDRRRPPAGRSGRGQYPPAAQAGSVQAEGRALIPAKC